MKFSHRALALTLVAVVAPPDINAFASVVTVTATGAPYTQIQNAVNAASDGDVILISPGNYAGVTIDGKSLTLCNKGGGIVTLGGRTTVRNLTASQRVVLTGLNDIGWVGSSTIPDDGVALLIENNAGSIRVEYCTLEGGIGGHDLFGSITGTCNTPSALSSGRNGAIVRNNSGGVSFTACTLTGGRGANADFIYCVLGQAWWGGDGLSIEATLVALYDCICTGGRGGENHISGNGGFGCRTISGSSPSGCFASGTTFTGGFGGNGWYQNGVGGAGGHGLFVGPSTGAHLLDNTYFGGMGGFAMQGGAPGAPITGPGSIFYHQDSKLVMTTERVARAGSVIDLRVQGTPGQNIRLFVSRAPTFQIMASWRGTLLSLAGKGAVEVSLGPIPANGILQTRYIAPQLPPGFASIPVFVQAYRDDPVLGPKLAAGTCITLLP